MNQHKPVEQIIVIGVSSGGLAALRVLLEQFPRDLPAAVFITMHIGDQPSLLPSLLTHTSSLDIGFAASGARPANG
jgi:two-component system chemotaxis response regulator CheB